MQNIPTESFGVIVSEDKTLSYGSYPLPELGETDVLIKIHSAPINPADLLFIQGIYPTDKERPVAGGLEGSGTVIAAGSHEKAQALLNQRVAFATLKKNSPGSWGQYTVQEFQSCLPYAESIGQEEGACAIANPMTAEGFLNICDKHQYNCIVHSAAASQFGKLLVSACKTKNITLINFVRRPEQVEILKELGAENIISTGDSDWKNQTTKLFGELKPQAFFDAIGGETASTIFSLMPNNTTTYNYGALSLEPISVTSTDLIFNGKTLTGYWLANDFVVPEIAGKLFTESYAKLAAGTYKTLISGRFSHDKFEEALEFYKNNCSKGKVLFQAQE